MSVDRLAALLSSSVVILAVIAGLIISGSPTEQRLKRLDKNRESDLLRLSIAVDSYWDRTKELPKSLTQMVDGRRLNRLPTDPVTGIPYEYHVDGDGQYRLCAQFDRASKQEDEADFWAHPQGQKCYSMNADQEKQ